MVMVQINIFLMPRTYPIAFSNCKVHVSKKFTQFIMALFRLRDKMKVVETEEKDPEGRRTAADRLSKKLMEINNSTGTRKNKKPSSLEPSMGDIEGLGSNFEI